MTGETGKEESGWTTDTLKVLVDRQFGHAAELRRADQEALALLGVANQRAQDKFEESVTTRFVQVNEFRGSLDDLSKGMATRRETEATFAAITARIDDMAKQIGDLRSRIDVGPAGLQTLQSRVDTSGGRQQGVTSTQQLLIALAGILIAFAVYWGNHQKPTPVVVNPTVTVPATK